MRRSSTWAVLALPVVLVASACGSGGGTKTASVEIKTPAATSTVRGNVVTLDLSVKNINIVKADGNMSGKTGHFHVFIDAAPVPAGQVIPKTAAIIHSTEDPLQITGLHTGKHTLTVVLGDGAHRRIGTSEAKVTVTVEGPSVDATAPATVPAGQPFAVDVATEGVQLLKADGDTSGRTGHLHLFIDKTPVLGQPIPTGDPAIIHTAATPIAVPALSPGEHTLWVVLGNGAHVPFTPPVMDKVTVMAQ